MKCRKASLILLLLIFAIVAHAQNKAAQSDRAIWLHYLDKLAAPVLSNLAEDKLKEKMPLVLSVRIDNKESRTKAAYLEAFGRVMTGISPWLNTEGGSNEEIALRNKYRAWALKAFRAPTSPMV